MGSKIWHMKYAYLEVNLISSRVKATRIDYLFCYHFYGLWKKNNTNKNKTKQKRKKKPNTKVKIKWWRSINFCIKTLQTKHTPLVRNEIFKVYCLVQKIESL